jgi:hypothetical protein
VRTDPDDLARIGDPAIELLFGHTPSYLNLLSSRFRAGGRAKT